MADIRIIPPTFITSIGSLPNGVPLSANMDFVRPQLGGGGGGGGGTSNKTTFSASYCYRNGTSMNYFNGGNDADNTVDGTSVHVDPGTNLLEILVDAFT